MNKSSSENLESSENIGSNTPLSRITASIERVEDEVFEFRSYSPEKVWRVNPVVASAWCTISQNMRTDEFIDALQIQFPLASNVELNSLLEEMLALGILHTDKKPFRYTENISVYFYRTDLKQSNTLKMVETYVRWLFWNIAHCVTIVENPKLAEVHIYLNHPKLTDADDDIISVLATNNVNACNPDDFDYIIAMQGSTYLQDSSLYFPSWLNTENWTRIPPVKGGSDYFNNDSIVQTYGDGYDITRQSSRLSQFLYGELPAAPQVVENKPSICACILIDSSICNFDFVIKNLQLIYQNCNQQIEFTVFDCFSTDSRRAVVTQSTNECNQWRYVPIKPQQAKTQWEQILQSVSGQWALFIHSSAILPCEAIDHLLEHIEANINSDQIIYASETNDSRKNWLRTLSASCNLDQKIKIHQQIIASIEADSNQLLKEYFAPVFALSTSLAKSLNFIGGSYWNKPILDFKSLNNGAELVELKMFQMSLAAGNSELTKFYQQNKSATFKEYLKIWHSLKLPTQLTRDALNKCNLLDFYQQESQSINKNNKSPFLLFGEIVCINLNHQNARWNTVYERFRNINISANVKRIPAVHTPENHHVGCALSHRKAIQYAADQKLNSIVVFEDDAMFLSGADTILRLGIESLYNEQWKILFLGGYYKRQGIDSDQSIKFTKLTDSQKITCTHGVIYHHSCYQELLESLPNTYTGMLNWIVKHKAIDQYLNNIQNRFVLTPNITQQREHLRHHTLSHRYSFK